MRPFRFLLLLLLLAKPLFALDVPPAPREWFTDTAGMVSTTDAAMLNTKLKTFEEETGAQFLIYTLPSIEDDAIEDWTIRAARQWAVGQKKYDNGLILFVFAKDRKARVEVGYGLEGTITDAVSSRVIREQLAPHFQQNDYAGGLNAAANELMRLIRTHEKPVPAAQPSQGGRRESGGFDIGILVFIAVFLFLFILPLLRRRRSGCGGCIPIFLPMGGGGITFGGGGFSSGGFGGFSGGGGGGGFSGGGGGFGGGGATGGW